LKWGGAVLVGSGANLTPRPVFSDDTQTAPPCEVPEVVFEPCSGGDAIEVYPTSPLIGGYVDGAGVVRGSVFTDPLIVPPALRPVPISAFGSNPAGPAIGRTPRSARSEEHTSELQSRENLVCRLLLEKKKAQVLK